MFRGSDGCIIVGLIGPSLSALPSDGASVLFTHNLDELTRHLHHEAEVSEFHMRGCKRVRGCEQASLRILMALRLGLCSDSSQKASFSLLFSLFCFGRAVVVRCQ